MTTVIMKQDVSQLTQGDIAFSALMNQLEHSLGMVLKKSRLLVNMKKELLPQYCLSTVS